jgi:hypothetical protein
VAEQELQERFGDGRAALALLGAGHEIHTTSARYRVIGVSPTDL